MENKKTFTQEEVERGCEHIMRSIVITATLMELEYPGSKEAILKALISQMKAMLPGEQADTCCSEGPVGQKEACRQKTANEGTACVCMTFGDALEAMKDGKRAARKGWNGKGMYVFLAHGTDYVTDADISAYDQLEVEVADMLVMKTAQDTFQPGWLASQADMLAEDWYIV